MKKLYNFGYHLLSPKISHDTVKEASFTGQINMEISYADELLCAGVCKKGSEAGSDEHRRLYWFHWKCFQVHYCWLLFF